MYLLFFTTMFLISGGFASFSDVFRNIESNSWLYKDETRELEKLGTPYSYSNTRLDFLKLTPEMRYWGSENFSTPTYGLPNCYCRVCNPETTVGKLYNGICYSVTSDEAFRWQKNPAIERFRLPKEKLDLEGSTSLTLLTVMNVHKNPPLQIATLHNITEAIIFMQIASEFFIKGYFRKHVSFTYSSFKPIIPHAVEIGLRSNNKDVLSYFDLSLKTAKKNPACPTLLLKNSEVKVVSQCHIRNYQFLKSSDDFFDVKRIYIPVQMLKTCSFQNDAVAYEDFCFQIKETDSCELVSISDDSVLRTVHYQLVNRTQNEASRIGPYNGYYKISSFHQSLKINLFYYTIDISSFNEQRSDKCLFIDMQGKRVVVDDCGKSRQSVCVIRNAINNDLVKNQISDSIRNQIETHFIDLKEQEQGIKRTNASSTYGLQNCYCVTCDPEKTVGKIYNKECYFITTNLNVSKGAQNLNGTRYLPAILDSKLATNVLRHVLNEFSTKSNKHEIGLYTYKNKKTVHCIIFDTRINLQTRTCNHVVLDTLYLKAKKENFITLRPFQIPDFPPCSFDKKAVAMVREKHKCIKAVKGPSCELSHVTQRNFDNVHNYLLNITHPMNETYGTENQTVFKVATIKGNLMNKYAGIFYDGVSRKKAKCAYINLMTKEIMYSAVCDRPSTNLCMISKHVELNSNSGLTNCICKECNPKRSVGILYNGTCFFASYDSKFKRKLRSQNSKISVLGKYIPLIVTDISHVRILQQLWSELFDTIGEPELGFFSDPSKIDLKQSLIPTPAHVANKCQVFQGTTIMNDCKGKHAVVLQADKKYVDMYNVYVSSQYDKCPFNPLAVHQRMGYCLIITSTNCTELQNSTISWSHIYKTSLTKYLAFHSQPRANELAFLMHTYKIDPVNFGTQDKCHYFDVQGKQVFQSTCNLNTTYNVCLINKSNSKNYSSNTSFLELFELGKRLDDQMKEKFNRLLSLNISKALSKRFNESLYNSSTFSTEEQNKKRDSAKEDSSEYSIQFGETMYFIIIAVGLLTVVLLTLFLVYCLREK